MVPPLLFGHKTGEHAHAGVPAATQGRVRRWTRPEPSWRLTPLKVSVTPAQPW
jgi:hypothetical protein